MIITGGGRGMDEGRGKGENRKTLHELNTIPLTYAPASTHFL